VDAEAEAAGAVEAAEADEAAGAVEAAGAAGTEVVAAVVAELQPVVTSMLITRITRTSIPITDVTFVFMIPPLI